jgi:hypothetical protein
MDCPNIRSTYAYASGAMAHFTHHQYMIHDKFSVQSWASWKSLTGCTWPWTWTSQAQNKWHLQVFLKQPHNWEVLIQFFISPISTSKKNCKMSHCRRGMARHCLITITYCDMEEVTASVKITVFALMDYRRVKIPQSGETNWAEAELYRVQHA